MLFLVAAVALSIGAGSWWLQRVAFTPDSNRDTAAAILRESDIRVDLNQLITGAAAPAMDVQSATLSVMLEEIVLTSRPGAAELAPIIEQVHNRIIGNSDEAVVITGEQMIPIVRDERAADAADVTLPVATIGVLSTLRASLGWIALVSSTIGAIALALGILARPGRRDVYRGLGEFGFSMAVSVVVFGYVIPVWMLPAIDNQTWTYAVRRLAERALPVVVGAAAVFAIAGAVLIIASTSGGKRRQWSTPLSVARYQGGENPGWR